MAEEILNLSNSNLKDYKEQHYNTIIPCDRDNFDSSPENASPLDTAHTSESQPKTHSQSQFRDFWPQKTQSNNNLNF